MFTQHQSSCFSLFLCPCGLSTLICGILVGVACFCIACSCTFHIFSTWTDRNEKSHFHSSFYVYYQSVFIWHFRTEIILHSTLLILIFTNISCVRHHCQTHSMNLADFPCSFFVFSLCDLSLSICGVLFGVAWLCMACVWIVHTF